MPQTLSKSPSQTPAENSVKVLASRIQKILVRARKKAEAAVGKIGTRAYWQVGKFIEEDLLKNKNRAGYGERLILDLAKISGLRERLLYDSLSFYKKYPILPSRAELTWSHYRNLLTLEDSKQRKLFGNLAQKSDWPVAKLEEEIQKSKQPPRPVSPAPRPVSFKPRQGELHTCLIRLPTQNSEIPALDLGFYIFKELTARELSRFKEGDIVKFASDQLTKSDAARNQLYTYEAALERVVDGDTLWVKIFLGFGICARKKLRLRGIDCPELNTPAGKRAKKFVEGILSRESSVLSLQSSVVGLEKKSGSKHRRDFTQDSPLKTQDLSSFVVTTTKPDKYDRYLSDIWMGDITLNQLLLEHGHARLKTSYAKKDWGK